MRSCDTWVCVADGEHARFYRCDGGRDLEPVLDFGIPAGAAVPFSGRLAGQLDRAARHRMFDHLVLVGPMAFLRELEGALAAPTRAMIFADVLDRGLMRSTPRSAVAHLSEVLPN